MLSASFETFTPLEGGQAAYDACRALAEGCASFSMPLVLIGPPKSGKTHLLRAVEAGWRSRVSEGMVCYVSDVSELPLLQAIEAGPRFLLLIDGPETFKDSAPLETLVVGLLRGGGSVAVAVESLPALPPGFEALLMAGTCVETGPSLLPDDLDQLNGRLQDLSGEFESLRIERDRLSEELQRRRQQTTAVRSLQQELDETLAEHARLQGQLTASRELEDTVLRLTEERDSAREEARQFRAQVESLCERIEQSVHTRAEEVRRIRELWSERSRRSISGEPPQESEGNECSEAEQVRLELEGARGQISVLEGELRKANRQLALRAAEADVLQHTAVNQVAAANVHAGELDQRVAQLEAALEITRVTGRAIETDAERIGGELARAAAALRLLAERQDGMEEGLLPSPQDQHQPILFDLGDYAVSDGGLDSIPMPSRPTYDPNLLDVIEEAFRPRPTDGQA